MNNPDQNRVIATLAMIMAASLVGLITGYTVPLISLTLAQQQADTLYVGFLAALPPAGMMLSSFLSPALCRRFAIRKLTIVSLILLAIATAASCLTDTPALLIFPRLVTGLSSGVIIVLSESWVTGNTRSNNRAMLTGIYTSAFTGCQLAGPLLLSAGDKYQLWSLIAIVSATAACLLMLRRLPPGSRNIQEKRESWKSLTPFLPVMGSGVFCFAFFDASILSLFPLYGIEKGLDENIAVLLITFILVGDALLQIPLGWLADKVGVRAVHLGCAIIFCLALLLIPSCIRSYSLLIIDCFILGASGGALYTLSLVRAGKALSGQKLIMMNAMLGFIWSAGSIAGPVISGLFIYLTDHNALIVSLLAIGILFLIIQWVSKDESMIKSPGH